jgi:hypothetical protein
MNTPPQPPPGPSWAWWYENARRPPGGPDYRVSDAERNSLAELLSQHYADGRLDETEFKERMDRAMSAKTRSDLNGLTADLPPLGSEAPVATRRHPHAVGRRRRMSVIGLVFAVVIVSWSLSSAFFFVPHVPWLLVAIVAVLLWRRHSWRSWHRHQHEHSRSAVPPFG